MSRIVKVGFFTRRPDKDLWPQEGSWVAWERIGTGGIYYCTPAETYDIALKEGCQLCKGTARTFDCISETNQCPFRPWWGGLCRVCGKSSLCQVCDGTGVTFLPTAIMGG